MNGATTSNSDEPSEAVNAAIDRPERTRHFSETLDQDNDAGHQGPSPFEQAATIGVELGRIGPAAEPGDAEAGAELPEQTDQTTAIGRAKKAAGVDDDTVSLDDNDLFGQVGDLGARLGRTGAGLIHDNMQPLMGHTNALSTADPGPTMDELAPHDESRARPTSTELDGPTDQPDGGSRLISRDTLTGLTGLEIVEPSPAPALTEAIEPTGEAVEQFTTAADRPFGRRHEPAVDQGQESLLGDPPAEESAEAELDTDILDLLED